MDRPVRLFVAALVMLCLVGAPASALTVSAPADVNGATDVLVTLAEDEPTGTVVLYDGDAVVGSQATSAGTAYFSSLLFAAGTHVLRAALSAEGTTAAVSPDVALYAWASPGPPAWVGPTSRTVMSPCTVRLTAGSSTASMTLRVAGRVVKTVACRPGQRVTFAGVRLPSHVTSVSVEAESLTGQKAVFSRRLVRREFPYATCILIDKSDFRLYWVKNQQVVKSYPIAHGRYNWTPVAVWKVLAKYKTAPKGIYGPRKLRMFRRVGTRGHYRYVFTAYGIHGTDQPWVIGTMASHGCIRMYNRDVLDLWPRVPLGTMVVTRA